MINLATLTENLMIGLGIMFGLALVMTYLTYKDTESFFVWLTVFSGFVVWSGLVDLWILVINIIILSLIMLNNIYKRRSI